MKNSENIHDIHNRQKANIYNIKVKLLSRVRLFATPWAIAYQTPPSMGFSRQEYWSGLLFPSPGALSDPGIEPASPALQADSLPSESPGIGSLFSWNETFCVLLQSRPSSCVLVSKSGDPSQHFVSTPVSELYKGLVFCEITFILGAEKSFLLLPAQCQFQQL